MCTTSSRMRKYKKPGFFKSFLFKDYYAEELRFNLRGNE